MTFVGKVLVVMHLVLSMVFMGFAGAVYTAQKNWLTKYEAAVKEAATKDSANKAAIEEKNKTILELETKSTAQVAKIAGLEGEKTSLERRALELDTENKANKTALDAQLEIARLSTGEASERTAESQLQRAKNSELYQSRADLLAKLSDESNKAFSANLRATELETRNESLLKQVGALRSLLRSKNMPDEPAKIAALTEPPPKGLLGVVLDAKKTGKGKIELLELSIGRDDGLVEGHELTVYRADKYLGRVRIDTLSPDKAIGIVFEKSKNTSIEKGDNVSSEL